MSILAAGTPVTERVRASLGVFISLAGLTCGITLLFLGMRSVMEIGGACAEGGPFVPIRPCPSGVPALMIGGIWGGLIFCAIYAWQTIKWGVPSLLGLAWPALFLSLGWNFFEYSFNPPGEDTGVVWGWLICGTLFFFMGGLPLFAMLRPIARNFTEDKPPPSFGSVIGDPIRILKDISVRTGGTTKEPTSDPFSSSSTTVSEPPPSSAGLVGELERLAVLHRSGALGDSEYAAAKRRLLEDGS